MPEQNKPVNTAKEVELIKACQRNDRKAQSEFYRLYSAKFLGIVYRFAGDFDTANDLLQEGFIKIFRHINDYRFDGSFEGWMKRIIIRTSIDYIKKHHKLYFEEINEDHQKDVKEEANTIEKMNCDAIINAITQLPKNYATVLNLYAIEGYSYSEISAMLEIKEVTVRSQYMRAKQKLAVILSEQHHIPYAAKIV